MAAAGASPSSSPRLPSPPPFTEVQIGPKSPTVSDGSASSSGELFGAAQDESSTRRIQPGTKAVDMASGPPLIPLSQLDSPFQLQEHLKALYHNYTRPAGSSTVVPINHKVATQLAEPPEGVERSLWLYELCRFLTMRVNSLIVAFFAEEPPCSAQTCPEMRASEWQYLCAVHDPPKSCCAIDYCCHTLDWATNILTSPKHFPSRLTLGSDASGGPQASMRHLTNIFRRLYRIFAHAWFQHRDIFWQVEGNDGLYVFFKAVCDVYKLIPEDNYTVPPEAEGKEPEKGALTDQDKGDPPKMTILRKEDKNESDLAVEEDADSTSLNPATTRRHKYSASRGGSVSTIVEAAEDDEDHNEDDEAASEVASVLESTDNRTGDPSPDKDKDQHLISGGPSAGELVVDRERDDMDNSPSNIEQPASEAEHPEAETAESDHKPEDIGSPGPPERNPELVVDVQPQPEEDKDATAEADDNDQNEDQTTKRVEQEEREAKDDESNEEQRQEKEPEHEEKEDANTENQSTEDKGPDEDDETSTEEQSKS